jgi:hypothetical protein
VCVSSKDASYSAGLTNDSSERNIITLPSSHISLSYISNDILLILLPQFLASGFIFLSPITFIAKVIFFSRYSYKAPTSQEYFANFAKQAPIIVAMYSNPHSNSPSDSYEEIIKQLSQQTNFRDPPLIPSKDSLPPLYSPPPIPTIIPPNLTIIPRPQFATLNPNPTSLNLPSINDTSVSSPIFNTSRPPPFIPNSASYNIDDYNRHIPYIPLDPPPPSTFYPLGSRPLSINDPTPVYGNRPPENPSEPDVPRDKARLDYMRLRVPLLTSTTHFSSWFEKYLQAFYSTFGHLKSAFMFLPNFVDSNFTLFLDLYRSSDETTGTNTNILHFRDLITVFFESRPATQHELQSAQNACQVSPTLSPFRAKLNFDNLIRHLRNAPTGQAYFLSIDSLMPILLKNNLQYNNDFNRAMTLQDPNALVDVMEQYFHVFQQASIQSTYEKNDNPPRIRARNVNFQEYPQYEPSDQLILRPLTTDPPPIVTSFIPPQDFTRAIQGLCETLQHNSEETKSHYSRLESLMLQGNNQTYLSTPTPQRRLGENVQPIIQSPSSTPSGDLSLNRYTSSTSNHRPVYNPQSRSNSPGRNSNLTNLRSNSPSRNNSNLNQFSNNSSGQSSSQNPSNRRSYSPRPNSNSISNSSNHSDIQNTLAVRRYGPMCSQFRDIGILCNGSCKYCNIYDTDEEFDN